MIYSSKKTKARFIVSLFILFIIINNKTTIYATIRGDRDNDLSVTAYDAYVILKDSLNNSFEESALQLIDMDCDTQITAYDAYSVLKKSISATVSD